MTIDGAAFNYRGSEYHFRAATANDHIVGIQSKTGAFYERDVLERLENRLCAKGTTRGAAVDAGAYIGNHSVYFGAVLKMSPIVSFEANSETIPILTENIQSNHLTERTRIINCALGSHEGIAFIALGPDSNRGASQVSAVKVGASQEVRMATLDTILREQDITDVALVKIDVEGAELDVLDGAIETLRKWRPILSIEVHGARQLREVLIRLEPLGYRLVDCLGYSPTYIAESDPRSWFTTKLVNRLWLARSHLTPRSPNTRWYLRRLAQVLTTGRWDPIPH